ncbi:hypothetical protein MO867_22295, partial [Microbulbifer sp. OS29]
MSSEGIAIVSYVLFLLSCIGGLISGFSAFFYILEENKHMKEHRKWGAAIPFSLFMPSFFTVTGNRNRKKSLKFIGCFLLCALLAGIAGTILRTVLGGEIGRNHGQI